VVYFHEQAEPSSPSEVSEYIITGGWPEDHPNHRRVPNGIHEQYVHLLRTIASELDRPGGPDLPNAWISGFYGSGKSSFAKLLGLALDGVELPDGTSLAEALLRRDTARRAAELAARPGPRCVGKIEPIAVVFDIGSVGRDNEHRSTPWWSTRSKSASATARTDPLVADFELKLERDGEWARFEQTASTRSTSPGSNVKDRAFAEEDFSLVHVARCSRSTTPIP
jgi:hypothetical protein